MIKPQKALQIERVSEAREAAVTVVAMLLLVSPTVAQDSTQHTNGNGLEWHMPMLPGGRMNLMMLPGMRGYQPPMTPFLPALGADPSTFPFARPREVVELADGDTLALVSMHVRRTINGKTLTMYGYNGQYPGPLIRVAKHTTVIIEFTNNIELPSTIHWHGIRLDNRFDGVPGVTQEPVQPGESFTYHVYFPDEGIYWYHPHLREDIQQELGLYGNVMVDPDNAAYYSPVNREEFLIFDDLLLQADDIAPFGLEASNNTLMGRFGNVFLINGEPSYDLTARKGEVVRLFLTNVSNTRVYNLSFGGARIKAVGGDIGKFEHEVWVPSVVLAPAERYIVEVQFDQVGDFAITNRVQAVDHLLGEFYGMVDTLGTITVTANEASPNYTTEFETLRSNQAVSTDIDGYRDQFGKEPDFELGLTIRVGDLPQAVIQFMSIDTAYFPPVEWNDAMPMLNWVSNAMNTKWILRDARTGHTNMDIDWRLTVGEVSKIRFRNDADAAHPMSHPLHLHGQRFLVIERDGVPNPNMVWKETVLVPVGSTVDILVDITNPGKWMLHCHIAEHLEAGMKMLLSVEEPSEN